MTENKVKKQENVVENKENPGVRLDGWMTSCTPLEWQEAKSNRGESWFMLRSTIAATAAEDIVVASCCLSTLSVSCQCCAFCLVSQVHWQWTSAKESRRHLQHVQEAFSENGVFRHSWKQGLVCELSKSGTKLPL